jgi:hypothetical protein
LRDTALLESPALEDACWAVVLGLCRAAYGPELTPLQVGFTHAAPACRGDYLALFGCPVQFDAAASELVLDPALADARLPAGNRGSSR